MRPKGAMRVGQKKIKPLAEGFAKAIFFLISLFVFIFKIAEMFQKAAFGLHLT